MRCLNRIVFLAANHPPIRCSRLRGQEVLEYKERRFFPLGLPRLQTITLLTSMPQSSSDAFDTLASRPLRLLHAASPSRTMNHRAAPKALRTLRCPYGASSGYREGGFAAQSSREGPRPSSMPEGKHTKH